MSTKAALKAAKAALDAEDYEKTILDANTVLSIDGSNYFARLFLGRAYEKQNKLEEAAKVYGAAATSKPDDSQAWLGLCSVFEAQGAHGVEGYRTAAVSVAQIFGKADDLHRSQIAIDKLMSFTKQYGTKAQYKDTLQVLLPDGPVYDFLEGRIQSPSLTYVRIAEITEETEAQTISQNIANRRTRLGARLDQVTIEVKREVYAKSDLENLYRKVIDWCSDDEVRRQYEEKLLERCFDALLISTPEDKATKLDEVLTLAEGMVIIRHAFQLAWDLVFETRDVDNLRELGANDLREYTTLFPDSALGKIIRGWLESDLSPFPQPKPEQAAADVPEKLSPEDRLVLMTDGLSATQDSPFAHRIIGDYLVHLEEFQTAADIARAGLTAIASESQKFGLTLRNTKDAINSVRATSLVHYQPPRHHPEARKLFEDILARKPKWTSALIGLGLILEEREEYGSAIDFLAQALEQDADNVVVGAELAWCRALHGDYDQAQTALETYLPQLRADDPRSRDLRAQIHYRIGYCKWERDSSKTARKDRHGAYASYLAAIKANANFAPAYASLGIYYLDYGKDKKRARQCFQKAFELSSAETFAAERLAQSFAAQGDWDIVEVISQRVIDSGRARPPPGSKRKGLSWPYSALGVVQMSRQDFHPAITSFLAALRISPDDYQSYVGLGESYHNSGRYNSALRTFNYALEPHDGVTMRVSGETWFAQYMLANVHRELGEYNEAIAGLERVLESRPEEFGVLMSLLQTFVEQASRCVELGLYGQAISAARSAIFTASRIAEDCLDAFNIWKAIGDATSVFASVESGMITFPKDELDRMLNAAEATTYTSLAEIDLVTLESLNAGTNDQRNVRHAATASILAFKRALHCCSNDIHAQAVAWYNLGWAEHRASVCAGIKAGRRYSKAAVHCFKRAIELEAGNADFWNALGVVTTILSPKVAQHSFVRSLHLSEMNVRVWTNLGVFYLSQNDHQLAHEAFGRAQSTDPEYAHAWLGEGLIALLTGDAKRALAHFTHAFEITDSTSLVTKRQYANSTFDHLLSMPSASNDLSALIQPIFALEQLRRQRSGDLPYDHLAALFFERVGNHAEATEILVSLCATAESDYESSESLAALARYAHAKSDLARNQFAGGEIEGALENAEVALDPSSDAENSGMDAESRTRLRMSAHLTAGLALHYLERHGEAISTFKSALEDSDADPEVICSLVKVLWAHGGEEQKAVAREQLFECVEKHPTHVGSITLLGAIAALDGDMDTIAAVKDDLISLRTKDEVQPADSQSIESLLSSLAVLSTDQNPEVAARTQAQTGIVLAPSHQQAWKELALATDDTYASQMALKTSQESVPPYGDMEASELAEAFAGAGVAADAQRSILYAPWQAEGWATLGRAASEEK